MRISDWSSDVCSSDLPNRHAQPCLKPKTRNSRHQPRGPGVIAIASSRARTAWKRLLPRPPSDIDGDPGDQRSEEHTSELQSLMRISYAVFCLKKKKKENNSEPCTHRQIITIMSTTND